MKNFTIALAAALLAATSSAALAQGYAGSSQAHQNRHVRQQSVTPLQQRNVALPTEARSAGPIWYNGSGPTSGGM
jgi:hypothetical protein